MTDNQTYQKRLADRYTIRKSGGAPTPLPRDLEPAGQTFVIDAIKSVLADDPQAALDRAIREAERAIRASAVAKGFQEAVAALTGGPTGPATTREEVPTMTKTREWVQKQGGRAQAEIDRLADEWLTKSAGRLTHAQAVDKVLSDPQHKQLYAQHIREQDAMAAQVEQRRLAPPPLPPGWTRPAWWPRES